MKLLLLIGLGGCLGAICRALLSTWLNPKNGFAYGTLCVNAAGTLLLGILTGYFMQRADSVWKPILGTGFLGGLTTFSTFSIETLQLLMSELWTIGILYFLSQILLGLGMGLIGLKIGQLL